MTVDLSLLLPEQLVSIIEFDGLPGSYQQPSLSGPAKLDLDEGEQLLAALHGDLTVGRIALKDHTTIVVTDRRVAWSNHKFDTGGGWAGFGAAGLAVSVAANAVSKARAQKRSAGKTAAGHVRYEWIIAVTHRRQRTLIGSGDSYIDLKAATRPGTRTATLWFRGKETAEKYAQYIAQCAAARLLAIAPDLMPNDDINRLRGYVEGTVEPRTANDTATWVLASDFDAMKATIVREAESWRS